MRRIYVDILDRLEQRGWDRLDQAGPPSPPGAKHGWCSWPPGIERYPPYPSDMRRLTNHRTGRGSGGKSSTGTIHIIGGGLAGLACGVALTHGGCRVVLHEATRHAGGRCRSYQDAHLGRRLDNGNHLLLSGNHNARRFLNMTGGAAHMSVARRAIYPFFDLRDGARWIIHPNRGVIPWWVFCRTRRCAKQPPRRLSGFAQAGPGLVSGHSE